MKYHMKMLAIICISAIFLSADYLSAQKISRDLNVDIMINQAGYTINGSKSIVAKGNSNSGFEVINVATGNVVLKGQLTPIKCDFGDYSVADFSNVGTEGHYYIKSDTLRSWPFEISAAPYNEEMRMIVSYFSKQRCGNSISGYLTPCHLDDGVRMDNGKHQDVSGGWHDASDLRKWVGATIYGMIGLSKAYELEKDNLFKQRILDELKWGNRYFLNMQEPQGYIMSFVGGDVKKHSDSNRWTDNVQGKEGGELKFAKPDAGKSKADMLIYGEKDDRVIHTDPLDLGGQYAFIISEAIVARITKNEKDYSQRCLQAAVNCFNWCEKKQIAEDPRVIGASMQAALELYKTTNDVRYMNFVVKQAESLKALQVKSSNSGPSGFFQTSLKNEEPFKHIWEGHWGFISLCDMIRMFPSHGNVSQWKEMLSGFTKGYLAYFSVKNSFGIVPFGLFTGKDPGGSRKAGNYWYRYFMQPELEWWVGINANVASAGIGMIKASKILNDTDLKTMGQKQLDWIIGFNPLNSSTLIGVGYNHPKHFGGSTFLPNTPVIPGAVLNGLGGNTADQPMMGDGNWQISEYWTPMVAFTLWLMAEVSVAD